MRFLNNDPKNKKPQDNKPQNGDDGRQGRRIIFLMVAALIATLLINSLYTTIANAYLSEITYNEFQTYLDKDEIAELEFQSDRMVILTRDEAKKPSSQQRLYYTGYIPNVSNDDLKDRLDAQGVEYNTEIVEQASPIVTFVVTWLLPVIIMYALFSLLMRSMTKRMGGGIGESKAKVYMEKSTGVTFADVAGQDEAKESLVEIIDFLHNPEKYTAIGAKIPKGALLVGSPGTGKTLLAKAVAGEAKVPFFSISGSDFVEMFVGIGASRVRDLFAEASKVAPCIIFIDEIDTIGKSRDGSRYGGGNDEREQTLNQLLAEMDGFDPSKGVIVLAATNRPEVLDKALLRPGRFDRRITVDRPNLAGRLATLQVHTRGIKLAEDVDLKKVALATAGCVGADLANIVNEAALRAVRKGRKLVTQEDMLAAFEFVIAGSEKKNSVLTEFEKKLVAYHEVGHAMVAYRQKNAEPVQKITIVPHTEGSLGYTLLMPEEDKTNLRTRDELMAKIAVSMGGRAAEELVIGDVTTGAASDINHLTSIARRMVCIFGMSDKIGPTKCGDFPAHPHMRIDMPPPESCSPETVREIDLEVRRLVTNAMNAARECLRTHRDELEKLAQALLERETLSIDEINTLLGLNPEAEKREDVPGQAQEIRPTTDAGTVGNSL